MTSLRLVAFGLVAVVGLLAGCRTRHFGEKPGGTAVRSTDATRAEAATARPFDTTICFAEGGDAPAWTGGTTAFRDALTTLLDAAAGKETACAPGHFTSATDATDSAVSNGAAPGHRTHVKAVQVLTRDAGGARVVVRLDRGAPSTGELADADVALWARVAALRGNHALSLDTAYFDVEYTEEFPTSFSHPRYFGRIRSQERRYFSLEGKEITDAIAREAPDEANRRVALGEFHKFEIQAASAPGLGQARGARPDDDMRIPAVSVTFWVNNSPQRSDVGRLGLRILLLVRDHMKRYVAALPDGVLVVTSAESRDGDGDGRVDLYRKAGFGEPDADGKMQALSAGGRLVPFTAREVGVVAREAKRRQPDLFARFEANRTKAEEAFKAQGF